jgi:hypothetical protein
MKLKDKLNPGHYHEMMDRLHIMMENINDHLIQHPIAKVDKQLRLHLNNALEELGEAYQVAGHLDYENYERNNS